METTRNVGEIQIPAIISNNTTMLVEIKHLLAEIKASLAQQNTSKSGCGCGGHCGEPIAKRS